MIEILTFAIYFLIIVAATLLTYNKQKSDTQFVLGNRGLNFWLTALSAHASDMSNWLFMAYPAVIFSQGLIDVWLAIGLTVMMFLNWQFIAPKIRKETEKYNSLTLNGFLESRYKDKTKIIRSSTALLSLVFYVFYISAGLIGLGLLAETLFNVDYYAGISFGLILIVFYVFLGGYTTVAWLDLFQGLFLLFVVLFIPFYLFQHIGGVGAVLDVMKEKNLSASFVPDSSFKTIKTIVFLFFGWGLGYFGQPHIITKFMGIKRTSEMRKAQYVGISWQILALFGATLLGMLGIYLFQNGLSNPEQVVLEMVKTTLSPFFAGLVLCAILAATTNVMAAQILVTASSLSEDLYRKYINKEASHQNLLKVSRVSVVILALITYSIALYKNNTIYNLVEFAWSGLGATYGPILIASLYAKNITRRAAIAGILSGGLTAIIWPLINKIFAFGIPSLVIGFVISLLTIFITSHYTSLEKVKSR